MEEIKKEAKGLVKVKANYPKIGETVTLWGVDFEWAKDGYIAQVSKSDADAMVEANRIEIVK